MTPACNASPGRLALLLTVLLLPRATAAQDAFIDAVVSFAPGTRAGFGAESMPEIVSGPPRGGGATMGGIDIVSLGNGGVVVVRFDPPTICDGPGPDFTVFENAFHQGSPAGPVFAEYAFVAVSQDGINFIPFLHDPVTHEGLAGQTAVLSHPDNGIDPLDPGVSGGDQFDLATVGLPWAAYVRISDVDGTVFDPGDLPQFDVAPTAGFDLDAVAALHGCDPGGVATATPTATAAPPTATATETATIPPSPTATAVTPSPVHDASIEARRPLTVRVPRGRSEVTKRLRIKVRNRDGAGELPIRVEATSCGIALLSVDFDRRLAGAQDTSLVRSGKPRAATVSVTVQSADIDTPGRKAPVSCVATLTATAVVAGSTDPTPEDNTAQIELLLLDLNDIP